MKQQNQAEDLSGPMKMIFNYNNIFFSFFYDDTSGCIHRSREYAMNYVYSGEMLLDNGKEQIHVGKGECVFIPRDHHITMYKRTAGGERYCGIFLMFTRSFLKEMYTKFKQYKTPEHTPKLASGVIKLPQTAELASLFASMVPYFDPNVKPQDDLMQLKLQEGLLALLHIDKRFAPMLFDFNEPWKIDILDFMNQNYMYEFSMEELAHYSALHRTKPCHLQAGLQESERPHSRKVADTETAGSGIRPDEARRAEDSGCICRSRF